MRERLTHETFDLPEVSRQVGQRWQNLRPELKEFWKKAAEP